MSERNLWERLVVNAAKTTQSCSRRPKLAQSSRYLAAASPARWLRAVEFYVRAAEIPGEEDCCPYRRVGTSAEARAAGKWWQGVAGGFCVRSKDKSLALLRVRIFGIGSVTRLAKLKLPVAVVMEKSISSSAASATLMLPVKKRQCLKQ